MLTRPENNFAPLRLAATVAAVGGVALFGLNYREHSHALPELIHTQNLDRKWLGSLSLSVCLENDQTKYLGFSCDNIVEPTHKPAPPAVSRESQNVLPIEVRKSVAANYARLAGSIIKTPKPPTAAIDTLELSGRAITNTTATDSLMAKAGIPSGDFSYASYIISHESNWCPTAWQGEVGFCPGHFEPIYSVSDNIGYGLGQATPAGKMARFGSDWQTNPVTQLKWANSYADSRYGNWQAAYYYWVDHSNW